MEMGVQNCWTHIFPYTILVIIILGKHFPQTRRSLDRDQAKACLPNKKLVLLLRKSTDNKITKQNEKHPCSDYFRIWTGKC